MSPIWGIYSRHDDDTEVQPVPRISQERELPYAETSGQDFNEGFKGVDCSKYVPVGSKHGCQSKLRFRRKRWCRFLRSMGNLLNILCPIRRSDLCHKCTVGEDSAHDHNTEQRAGGGQGSSLCKI